MEDKETIVAPGTSAWTAEPTQDLLPSSVEGSSGTGQSQPKTIREDAVNSPGANPIQEMLLLINISCNDDNIHGCDGQSLHCPAQSKLTLRQETVSRL